MAFTRHVRILAALLMIPFLMGPAADIPEYISSTGADWTETQQSIDVEVELGERFLRSDDYMIGSYTLIVDADGNLQADIVTLHSIVTRGSGSDIYVAPLSIPWDRNEGEFTGPAFVCVMLEVLDRKGRPVKNAYDEVCVRLEIR